MKRLFFLLIMAFVLLPAFSEKQEADITFEKTSHDFGAFSEKDPKVSCVFAFTNTGTAPLVINQAIASCGCTVPVYTEKPVQPGEKGEITVTYNGKGRFPGHFKKIITVTTNAKNRLIRLSIEGNMTKAEE